MVNEDQVNHVSDKGVGLSGQETIYEDVETSDTPQDGGVCQGKRNGTPRGMSVPAMQGKAYARGKYEGVGFPMVRKRSTKGGELRNQFTGAGYCTKRGVLNL